MPSIHFLDVTNRDGVQTARTGLSKFGKTMVNFYLGRLGAGRLGHLDGLDRLADDARAVQLAAELVAQHLIRRRDRQVVVLEPELRRALHVTGDRAAPAGEPQVAERAGLRERGLRADVGHLVEQEREADLGLRDAQLAQVEVDHRLAELRQPGPGRLHPVAVRDVEEVDACHVH